MFEKSKPRYLTRGVDENIPLELQMFMWEAVDIMPEPKDYLQILRLESFGIMQRITHEQEIPKFKREYLIPTNNPITAKVYIIDDGEYCTMLLASEDNVNSFFKFYW